MIHAFILILIYSMVGYAGCTNNQNSPAQKQTELNRLFKSVSDGNDSSQVKKMPEMPTVAVKVAPIYPEEARKKGIQGEVQVQILVGADGLVKKATVMRNETGSKAMEKAALEAINQWKFNPGKLDGKPVEVHVVIPIKFKLKD